MSDLPPDHDDAVKQAQWLWDVAYKHAVHSIGIEDFSKMSFEDKKKLDITQAVLFKAMTQTLNTNKLITAMKSNNKSIVKDVISSLHNMEDED
jgi:hypothetical protein